MSVLREAHARGLRTYAMFCPLLPGIADAKEQVHRLVQVATEHGAEEIFAEPVNPRGLGLPLTQEVLQNNGYQVEAAAVKAIRRRVTWSRYVLRLIRNVQDSVRQLDDIRRLRVLLYRAGLTPGDVDCIRQDGSGVVWPGRD